MLRKRVRVHSARVDFLLPILEDFCRSTEAGEMELAAGKNLRRHALIYLFGLSTPRPLSRSFFAYGKLTRHRHSVEWYSNARRGLQNVRAIDYGLRTRFGVIPVYFNEENLPAAWPVLEKALGELPEELRREVNFVVESALKSNEESGEEDS